MQDLYMQIFLKNVEFMSNQIRKYLNSVNMVNFW